MATGTSPPSENSGSVDDNTDKLKELYPAVNEKETPLPRSWSPKDKYNFIGLSQNNLRVHYKGDFCLCFSLVFYLVVLVLY